MQKLTINFKRTKRLLIFCLLFPIIMLSSCSDDEEWDMNLDTTDNFEISDTSAVKELKPFSHENITGINKYMRQGSYGANVQGGDIYGDYLFQFENFNQNIYVYNLKNKRFVAKLSLEPNPKNHCNNANFSRIFYSEEDRFPLLYVSNSSDGSHNQVQVYRITVVNGVLSIEQVQEIVLPKANANNLLSFSDAILDNEHGFMYVTSKGRINGVPQGKISKYKIPDPHQEKLIRLNEADTLATYKMECLEHNQGAFCRNGYIYISEGVPAWNDSAKLNIYNMNNGAELVTKIDLTPWLDKEPEALFHYKGDVYIACNKGDGIYRIYLY